MKLNAMIGIRDRRIAAPLAAALAAICAATTALPSYADSITVAPVVDANGLETSFNLTLDVAATRYLCAALAASKPTRFLLQVGDLVQGDCNSANVHTQMLNDADA